eukprot:2387844-Amphidinium_carterae.1
MPGASVQILSQQRALLDRRRVKWADVGHLLRMRLMHAPRLPSISHDAFKAFILGSFQTPLFATPLMSPKLKIY